MTESFFSTAAPRTCCVSRVCMGIRSGARRAALGFLRGYKLIISPWIPAACRFTPTCSEYASDAIERYGVLKGTAKATRRLLSCHPFHRGGWDPA
jgi:putative membrane protein insertion efficiency factor